MEIIRYLKLNIPSENEKRRELTIELAREVAGDGPYNGRLIGARALQDVSADVVRVQHLPPGLLARLVLLNSLGGANQRALGLRVGTVKRIKRGLREGL